MRGPFYRTIQFPKGNGLVENYRRATWYRSDIGVVKRKPLPYSVTQANLVRGTKNVNGVYDYDAVSCWIRQYLDSSFGRSNLYGNTIEALHNKTYAAFLDKVRAAPQIGVDIAERKQTLRMLSVTLGALRRPLKTFSRAYERYRKRGVVISTLKDAPNAWLAFHFGVEPLLKDVHDLVVRLGQAPKPMLVSVSKSQTLNYSFNRYGQNLQESYKQHVRIAAAVTRIHENVSLLNDLGLVNPASIAWELVPFSFVVDWFYPVGSYLNSMSDLLGYKIENPYRTRYVTAKGFITNTFPFSLKTDPSCGKTAFYEGYRMERTLDVPAMTAQKVRIPANLSPSRAATQVSLLLQILMKNR